MTLFFGRHADHDGVYPLAGYLGPVTGVRAEAEPIAPQSSGSRRRYLVFTSAGDRSSIHRWINGPRNFDLWICYYGDHPGSLRGMADRYLERKGTKFQNLHFCYLSQPEAFQQYDAVMVLDDDLLIGARALNQLFEIREQLDLWLLQPAFRPVGKISWDITRVRPTSHLRYTSFVEMTCPLFRRDKLDDFMAVFDPAIAGYGEDWWFLHNLGQESRGRVAIVDSVTCVNPFDSAKGGRREIDRASNDEQRKAIWDRLKSQYGLDEQRRMQAEYGRIRKPAFRAWVAVIGHLPDRLRSIARALAWRALQRLRKARHAKSAVHERIS